LYGVVVVVVVVIVVLVVVLVVVVVRKRRSFSIFRFGLFEVFVGTVVSGSIVRL
jgi:hypothetical protein